VKIERSVMDVTVVTTAGTAVTTMRAVTGEIGLTIVTTVIGETVEKAVSRER